MTPRPPREARTGGPATMIVAPRPPGPPPSRFERVAGAVETFRFLTDKVEIEAAWATSGFYGPDFFRVSVRDRAGRPIWSGGDALFLDTLFRVAFFSDTYDRMVLTRVHDTGRSDSLQVVLVDLKTGAEQVLTPEGGYEAGLFVSFDGLHILGAGHHDVLDLASGARFPLGERLAAVGAPVVSWGTCPVPGCILVVTGDAEDNLVLLDLLQGRVRERATLRWRASDHTTVTVEPPVAGDAVDLTVSHATRTAAGSLTASGTERFRVTFGGTA